MINPKTVIRACLDSDYSGVSKASEKGNKKTAAAGDYPCSQPAAAVYLMSAYAFISLR